MAMEYIPGLMGEDMKESGRGTTCMAKVPTLGQMEESMREPIKVTKKKASASTYGLTGEDMRGTGRMGSSMGKACM